MAVRPNLREMPVEQLQWGMFVSELDRPWTETPFMFQGFVLSTEKQLETLKKFCKKVYVDPEKVQKVDPPRPATTTQPGGARGGDSEEVRRQLKEKVKGDIVYSQASSVEDELPRAQAVYQRTGAVVETLKKAVMRGDVLDAPRAKEAVTAITDSVVRNPDAMMLLTQLRERAAKTLDRALQVSVHMTVFGRFLQLPRDRLELLGLIGLLQDVGALKLPPGMAERRGEHTTEERELYKTHVQHTVETLSKTPGLPAELPGLASLHHERYDGSGYPRGLKGNAIPLLGSVAAVVDTFDMLTAPPPYGENMTPSAALSILYQNRGSQFHAAVVEQYIQCIGAFPVGAVVELNSGEVGIVIAQNMVRRLQPRVMVVQDAAGNPIIPHKIIDLVKEPKVTPDEIYRIRRTLENDKIQIDPKELFL